MNFVHPSQIVLEYYLGNPSFVVSSGKEEILGNIITDKIDITENIANILASVFLTSQEYWLNLQKQYDEKINDKPLTKMFEIETDTFKGAQKTISESCATKVLVSTYTEDGKENINPVYILTEQAYNYFVSKCTEDEAWDLGWFGQSEKHAKRKDMPEALKRLVAAKKQEQVNPAIHELVRMGNGIGGTRISGKTKEETEQLFNEVLDKAKLDHGTFISDDYTHGVLDLEDMNKNPTKYATHILIADNSSLIIESTETCSQLLFINNSWQPSSIYHKLLKPYIKE